MYFLRKSVQELLQAPHDGLAVRAVERVELRDRRLEIRVVEDLLREVGRRAAHQRDGRRRAAALARRAAREERDVAPLVVVRAREGRAGRAADDLRVVEAPRVLGVLGRLRRLVLLLELVGVVLDGRLGAQ